MTAPSDAVRDVWNRVRGLGRKVEEELYDFSEEEEEVEEEPRGRNTLIALLNAFLTMWKASQANVVERTLGVLGFGGLLWLIVGDRGLGRRRWPLRIAENSATCSRSNRLHAGPSYCQLVWPSIRMRKRSQWPLVP